MKKENITHNQEKNKSIEIDNILIEMMKLANKDIKTAIINVFYLFRNLKKSIII